MSSAPGSGILADNCNCNCNCGSGNCNCNCNCSDIELTFGLASLSPAGLLGRPFRRPFMGG